MSRALALTLAALLVPATLHAHPVPKDNHDRTLAVHLTPSLVVVDYRLELDGHRAYRDLLDGHREALAGAQTPKQLAAAYCKHFAPLIADNLVATLDGQELTFRVVEQRPALLDHVRCDYRFVADWKPPPDRPGRFTFEETNYQLDSESKLVVRLSHTSKLT